MNRKGESNSLFRVRGERYFKLYDYWFFGTREGATVGPFDSRELAIQGTRDYIEFITSAPDSVMKVLYRENRLIA
jgi:hypothetical protein